MLVVVPGSRYKQARFSMLPFGGLLLMMGCHSRTKSLFYYFLEDQIPENHLLRLIDRHVNFEFIRAKLKDVYSDAEGHRSTQNYTVSTRSVLELSVRIFRCHSIGSKRAEPTISRTTPAAILPATDTRSRTLCKN
jgi:hypothetical protein